jgi:hypothetical protein
MKNSNNQLYFLLGDFEHCFLVGLCIVLLLCPSLSVDIRLNSVLEKVFLLFGGLLNFHATSILFICISVCEVLA